MLYLVVCLWLAVASAADVRDLCPKITPHKRDLSSLAGTWFIVAATNMSAPKFGIKVAPLCDCNGFIFTSDKDSNITRYDVSNFACILVENNVTYRKKEWIMSLVDKTQPWSVYFYINVANGKSSVAAILDTDDGKTFLILYFCGITSAAGAQQVVVLTKDRAGLTDEAQKRVAEDLKMINFTGPLMYMDPKYCPDVQF